MCTERKATGLFVLTNFLCDNEVNCVTFGPLYDLSVLKGIVMDHFL